MGINPTKSLELVWYKKYLTGMLNPEPAPLSHSGIIEREGGSAAVARKITEPANNVKAWKRNDSIPSPYWQKIVDAGLATYQELAVFAAAKAA